MESEPLSTSTSRQGFLRKLGTTVAIGLGVAAVPSRAIAHLSSDKRGGQSARPFSVTYTCCPDDGTHCVQNCGTGQNNYYCWSPSCQAFSFCLGCTTNTGSCFDHLYPGCQSPPPGSSKSHLRGARRSAL